jgi:hypothetical protein
MSITRKFKWALLSLFGLSSSVYSCDQPIEEILIKKFIDNPPHTLDHKITDKLQLQQIQQLWCGFQTTDEYPKLEEGKVNWTHSLTVTGGGKLDGIWLYQSKGFLGRLNNRMLPRYNISESGRFNQLLNLEQQIK